MENEKFCFELTGGPYGDETCNYNVTFPENATLRDLFKFISKRNEWGNIHRRDRCFDRVVAKYTKEGNFLGNPYLLANILDKKLRAVLANGGWSYMSYYVTLEEEDEEDVE